MWFKWKPSTSGATFADVCGAPTNHTVRVRTVKAGMPIYVYNLEDARNADADKQSLAGGSSFCRFRWRAVKDTTYYIQIDSQTGAPSDWELIVDQDTGAPAQPTIDASWPATTEPAHLREVHRPGPGHDERVRARLLRVAPRVVTRTTSSRTWPTARTRSASVRWTRTAT